MYRRAKCIWTSKQPIDGMAGFRVFLDGVKRRDDGHNRWFLFRRSIDLPSAPERASLNVTVDGRYQLLVNGRRVGRGPARCTPLYQRIDTYDLRPHLRRGDNVIALLVRVYGIDTSWYETVKGEWQAVFGDGALYCDGFAECGRDRVDILSDLEWRCLETTAWEHDTPRINWGLGCIESHDANAMPQGWSEPGFDDSGWDSVQLLESGGGPESLLGGMQIDAFPTLLPRELPMLAESPLAPQRILNWYAVQPDVSLPWHQRIYEESIAALPDGCVEQACALLQASDEATLIRTGPNRDVSVLLDFGRIYSAYPFIEIEAEGGEVVEVAVAEGMPGEWSELPEHPRLTVHHGHGTHLFRYIARPGRQRFERFDWSGFRYAQLTVRNAPHGLKVRQVGATYVRYPAEPRGRFECSDTLLTRLWEVGRDTLQQCMHDGWEDCPGREQRQWLGDATVEYLVGQAAFGPSVHALNRHFLRQAAESQRPDGLTQMFAPGDHHTNGVLIPDWTLQWILNAEQHWLHSADLATIEEIFPAIQRALAWFERQLDANDLVADLPYWNFHDWAALGRSGEAATTNAVLVGALRAAAQLAQALDSRRAAERYRSLATRIATALDRRHWDAERGVYVDIVDPATGTQDLRVSQHANAACILWDIAPRERWEAMVAWITDPDRVKFTAAPPIAPSGEPFDPATDVVMANTFFSHFVYRALCRAGRFDLVLAHMRERYGRMLARGATTLWESFDPTASLCHGFSATPVYQLSTEVLGIAPLEPGFGRFALRPQLADLDSASGVLATVRGDIQVEWKREADHLELSLTVPPGTSARFEAPAAYQATNAAAEYPAGTHRIICRPTSA